MRAVWGDVLDLWGHAGIWGVKGDVVTLRILGRSPGSWGRYCGSMGRCGGSLGRFCGSLGRCGNSLRR